MKIIRENHAAGKWNQAAFTLAEVVVALGLLGLVGAGLLAGISISFTTIQATRESLRATQILAQTMEATRLCNWLQTNPTNNFLPTSLTVPYDPASTNGLSYQVTVTITNAAAVSESYSNDLRMIQIQATWTSCNVQHTRSMSTYVSQYGLQNYVW